MHFDFAPARRKRGHGHSARIAIDAVYASRSALACAIGACVCLRRRLSEMPRTFQAARGPLRLFRHRIRPRAGAAGR